VTLDSRAFLLAEGATVSIGRLETNEICIREQHVSRQHAVIAYRDGVFTITDLNSANGVFVNDVRIQTQYPLMAGDVIRLLVPTLFFAAMIEADGIHHTTEHGTVIQPVSSGGRATLTLTNGPQEGDVIPLMLQQLRVGRLTSKADWEVCIPDQSVSRPHARLELIEQTWVVYDMGSTNGTFVNGTPINEKGRALADGDVVAFGEAVTLFRAG
jgi:pSer/pThr/pTyr-binding forkhead associated (FHA) protein